MGKLQTQVQELTDKLRTKEEENASLHQALSKAEQDLHEAHKAKEEQKPEPATTAVGRDLEQELQKAQDDCRDMEERKQNALGELDTRKRELDRERKERASDVQQLTLVRSELSALQHEFHARSDQTANRSASDASHYKERAKLQAELGAAKRQVEELEKEKVEMESVLEDLALDQEQLQEEKEAMQDRLEELKIDAETAQMEVEELRMEVEIAKEVAEGAVRVGGGSTGGDGTGTDADDVAQALSVQNARLREALIRLREQASVEKMELSRELRAAEKDAATGVALTEEVETLRAAKKKLEEEIRDLNEMVDQGTAFESMVESLSDRVMVLEDDNLALQSTIREMEEAADITAEMEEVQAYENKTLTRDLEGRDSIIRNLEEAIKMQRRREEDFQRTVGNYRKTVVTLKEEKKALMAFQEGDQGEKGDLLATSQKALARAAQLVADAAIARKRESGAVFDCIEANVQRHLSERLESLLPESVASTEVASVKGELLLSRVAGKASRSLEGMASAFTGIMRSGMRKVSSETEEETPVDEGAAFELSDEATQCITNMIHQSEVAMSTIDVASDLIKLLSAGQWPDLLSPDASTELGAIAGNSIAELDIVLGDQLRILKEEGVLSPHTSNIGAFQQTVLTTMQSLTTSLEADGTALFPHDWAPPGWRMLHDVSVSKFSCISAGAVVASVVSPYDGTYTSTTSSPTSEKAIASVKPLMMKLDQISTEATKSCHRLVRLDLQRESAVSDLTELAATWKAGSLALLETTKAAFSAKSEFTQEELRKCESVAESTMRTLVQFSSSLRAADLNSETDGKYHPFSPESKDAWAGVSTLARAVRSVDGDADDVNYLLRARALENQLAEAVENGPKLSLANTKVSTLEKVRMICIFAYICRLVAFWSPRKDLT
jgi:dynactin 1